MKNSKLLKTLYNIRKQEVKLEEKQDKLQAKWFKIANKCPFQTVIKASKYEEVDCWGCKAPMGGGYCNIVYCPLLIGFAKLK